MVGKEREARASERAQHRVGVQQVDVNDVAEALQEDHQRACPDWDARNHLWHPADVRGARPRESEESHG